MTTEIKVTRYMHIAAECRKAAGLLDDIEATLRFIADEQFDPEFHELTWKEQRAFEVSVEWMISRAQRVIDQYRNYTEKDLDAAMEKKYEEEKANEEH